MGFFEKVILESRWWGWVPGARRGRRGAVGGPSTPQGLPLPCGQPLVECWVWTACCVMRVPQHSVGGSPAAQSQWEIFQNHLISWVYHLCSGEQWMLWVPGPRSHLIQVRQDLCVESCEGLWLPRRQLWGDWSRGWEYVLVNINKLVYIFSPLPPSESSHGLPAFMGPWGCWGPCSPRSSHKWKLFLFYILHIASLRGAMGVLLPSSKPPSLLTVPPRFLSLLASQCLLVIQRWPWRLAHWPPHPLSLFMMTSSWHWYSSYHLALVLRSLLLQRSLAVCSNLDLVTKNSCTNICTNFPKSHV